MKERPILFSGAMVKAILAGYKTQTRRVIKPMVGRDYKYIPMPTCERIRETHFAGLLAVCPYGVIGDRLWVRETWRLWDACTDEYEGDLHTGKLPTVDDHNRRFWKDRVEYRASSSDTEPTWRPSMFMPRWASRLTLEVVKVRVERVQDISEADAIAEGVRVPEGSKHGPLEPNAVMVATTARDVFSALWDSINEKRNYSWDSNPWVWVIDFHKVKP